MDVRAVDERDSAWEDDRPRLGECLFGPEPGPYALDTDDVTGADVLEVIAWAGLPRHPPPR